MKIKLVKNHPKPYRVITDSEVEKYAEEHSTDESEVVTKLIQGSYEELDYIDMLSGHQLGIYSKS